MSYLNLLRTFLLVGLVTLVAACGESSHDAHRDDHGHGEEQEAARGPHGGRLLTDGPFSVELAIYEAGVPPEFRAWVTVKGAPVAPSDVALQVQLARLGGVTDQIEFATQGEFLRGDREVTEPHSFDVQVTASYKGQSHRWTYESYEGRTVIPADVAKTAGIETALAGPGTLSETIALSGAIAPDATRVRQVRARFAGVVQTVSKRIGDTVRAGETLATIESNESLRTYPVTSPIDGVITYRHAEAGEQPGDEPLFEIVDLSRVWAELKVFPRDRGRLKVGQRVHVRSEGSEGATGTLSYIAPVGQRSTQSVIARVVLENRSGQWAAGQFIEGTVTIGETAVALAVPLSALQTFRDSPVVFAQFDETYEVRPVTLGRRDAEHAEVLGGLTPGTRYVTRNSFLIKADIEKSGASHDH